MPSTEGLTNPFENAVLNSNLTQLEKEKHVSNYSLALSRGYEPPANVIAEIAELLAAGVLSPAAQGRLQTLINQIMAEIAPVITSNGGGNTASITIFENTTDVTNVVALDRYSLNGTDSLTFSIGGGADADLFQIDAVTGEFRFIAPPDYEAPVGGDNVYVVIVQVNDGAVLIDTQTISIIVQNVNEAATITGNSSGALVEDGALTASGTLTVVDVDAGEAVFAVPASLTGTYGSFSFNAATGAWGYMLNNAAANVQALAAGVVVTDMLTVSSLDGTASQTITVAITGTNDVASFIGTTKGAVAEDGPVTVSGTLAVEDVDAGEAAFAVPTSLTGSYGNFGFDATTGTWGYVLNNTATNVQALAAGAVVADMLTLASLDGTASQAIEVVITGTNDAAVISGTAQSVVAEDGTLTASGTLTVVDVDAGESVFAVPASLTGSYGSFSFDAATGAWGYILNNAAANVQALGAGAVVTDVLTVSSLDGTASQAIAVTINGTNDAAAISGTTKGAVAEDGTLIASGTVTAVDVDAGEAVFAVPASLTGSYGSFSFDAVTGAWGYMLNNAAANVQALAAGAVVTDMLTVSSLDGTASQAITVTINGTGEVAPIVNLGTLTVGQGFRLDGAAAVDVTGTSVAGAGDINGDGFDDILIGANEADFNGRPGSGSAYVIFGRAGGIANLDLAVLTPAQGIRIDGAASLDNTARSVASAGDINKDGIDDMIVGAMFADTNGALSGATYVVFGATDISNVDLASLSLTKGCRIDGEGADNWSGQAVASAGDVNHDGIDDVIIGAPRTTNEDWSTAGAAYVVFGKTTGLGSISLATLTAAQGFRMGGETGSRSPEGFGGHAGYSVGGLGDINNDGIDDFSVGAPYLSLYSPSGSQYVVYGKSGGWSDFNLGSMTPSQGFRIDYATAGGGGIGGGAITSAGDMNGDGIDDMLIAADPTVTGRAGALFVLYGKAGGLSNIDLGGLTPQQGFRIDGAGPVDLFGFSAASAGDFNKDGRDDLIVSSPLIDNNGTDSGSSYLIFGRTGGLPNMNIADFNGMFGIRFDGAATGEWSGQSVSSAGDVNKDGYDDLVIGARFADNNGRTTSGSAYVIYGHDYPVAG